jgi:hypothetical protein
MSNELTQVLGIVAISNKGEYNSETNYEKLNVVTYQGSSYCAKKPCKGIVPTNSEFWQLYAEKGETGDTGPQGPMPQKGVDYYTDADKTEIENDLSVDIHEEISEQIGSLVSATPLAASSVDGMTDTTRIYVNTTDGYWYYYNGSAWVQGDVYQSTLIRDNSINVNNLTDDFLQRTNIKYYEIKKESFTHGSLSYDASTNKVSLGTNQNRIRKLIKTSSGLLIKFSNPNNLYKYGIYACDREQNGIEIHSISDYNSSMDLFYVKGNTDIGIIDYRIALGYTNNATITDENADELNNAISFYYVVQENNNENLLEDSVTYNNCDFIVGGDDDNIPYTKVNTSYQDQYLTTNSSNHSIVFPVEYGNTYYIKLKGNINRNYACLYTADFKPLSYNGSAEVGDDKYKSLVDDHSVLTDEYTIEVTDRKFKYCAIYYYRGTDDDVVAQISKISMPQAIKPFSVMNFNIDTKDLFYLDIPQDLNRTVLYHEDEFADTQEMQGLSTDGTYLYYCMHGITDDDTSCVGKYNISTGQIDLKRNNTSYRHANGMCYYPKTNSLYISSLENNSSIYPDFYILDANTLEQKGTVKLNNIRVPYENYFYTDFTGFGGIAYSEELDRFVTLIRPKTRTSGEKAIYGLAIFTTNWNLDKLIKLESMPYHETRGGIWANDKYIYIVSTRNINNVRRDSIQIVDFEGNLIIDKILPTSPRDYIEGIVVDYPNNIIYTSNASDRIVKYDIESYTNIPIGKIFKNYKIN